MISSQDTPLCVHTHLSNGVHEFVITDPSIKAINLWVSQMSEVFQNAPPNSIVYVLSVHPRDRALPINYVSKNLQEMFSKFPKRARMRHAVLRKVDPMVTIINTFFRLSPVNRQDK